MKISTSNIRLFFCAGLASLILSPATAQNQQTPLSEIIPMRELTNLRKQEKQLFAELNKVIAPKSKQTVAIRNGRNRWIASGTVVGQGKVVTKLSELSRGPVFIQDSNDKLLSAKILRVDEENDLVLLSSPSLDAEPVDFSDPKEADVGSFLVAAGMNGKAAAFGVTSVPARNLREEDMALLGVMTAETPQKKGLVIENVPDGPARLAGIRGGDLLLSINDQTVNGLFRLRKLLLGFSPGEKIKVKVKRANEKRTYEVILGKRPEMRGGASRRLARMNLMGGNELSRQRDDYPLALQTDMIIKRQQAGAPVYNLDGEFMGITIARAGRIESFILPADVIKGFVEDED